MRQKQRKIAVILDNCSSHSVGDDLTNITVYFLPPNTTSHSTHGCRHYLELEKFIEMLLSNEN